MHHTTSQEAHRQFQLRSRALYWARRILQPAQWWRESTLQQLDFRFASRPCTNPRLISEVDTPNIYCVCMTCLLPSKLSL